MRRTALGGVLLIVAGAGAAQATPQLAGIAAQVTRAPVITTPNANSTIVALKQNRTLINWSSFDISKGQQVDFLFQNNSAIVLNRVSGPALIDGKLLGCVVTCGPGGSIGGNVWIYSPSGVIFGSNAQVNVGGLLATTSPLMSTQDFLSGGQLGFKFGGGPADGQVLVQSGAQIFTRGSLALIAPSVVTEAGSLIDAGGTALFGAAENYVIHFNDTANGLNLLDFEVPASALADGTVSATPLTISGQTAAGKVIIASVSKPSVMNAVISLGGMTTATMASDGGGGDIILSATGAPVSVEVTGQLQASHGVSLQAPDGGAITVSGAVSAASATGGGAIQLGGAGTGAVELAAGGVLNASATGQGQTGGSVVATANAVQVDGAITASGPAGGGGILVGGGAQGKNASVFDAATTGIGAGALLDASATANGAGGQVVVWSNQNTQFLGTIQSRGGPSGGAGGSAEVSSAGYLSYAGATDLRAADGTAGQLLLDPSELIIIPTGGADSVSSGINAPVNAASSTLSADAIDTALQSADVTISTHMSLSGGDGVIEFNGGAGPLLFANTGTTERTLSFVAESGFLFDTSVATKGQMNLTLDAGASPITIPAGAYVHVTDGQLTLTGSDLTLQGDLQAGTLELNASGGVSQSGGVITTSNLTGSSGGSTSLTDANKVSGVQTFNAGGDFSLTTINDMTLSNLTAAGAVNVASTGGTLFVSNVSGAAAVSLGSAVDIYISGAVSGPSAVLNAGGTINQVAGVITANTLTATATRGISLNDANAVAALGGLTNSGFGGIAFAAAGDLSLDGDVSAAAQHVSLVSTGGAITQGSGVITAGVFSAAAANGLSLSGSNNIASVSGLTSAAGDIAFADTAGFTLDGDVFAPSQTVSLISSGGAITQTSGSITADTFSASAVSGLILGGNNQVGHVTALSNSGSGGLTFNDNQSVTIDSVALGGGDISLSTSSGDLTLTSAVTSPGALTLAAGGNLTGTALTAATDITLTSSDTFAGTINFTSLTLGGDATLSAVTMSTGALQPSFNTGSTGSLSLTFTGALNPIDLSGTALSAPGSVSVTANDESLTVGSITAGANVTLATTGSLFQGEGGAITAASLTASAVNGLELGGPNSVASVTALTNTTSGSLSFNNNGSVTIGTVNQGGSGSINLNANAGSNGDPGDLTLTSAITSASYVYVTAANNLTVDGVTAQSDIHLTADNGVLNETPGAAITTGGDYYATALTMNAGAEQPIFTGSGGSLNLTFTQSGSAINLTGVPLSAPGSVTVQASNESLTVDSISAGSGDVTLVSGNVLAAAPGATINLLGSDEDTYSATAVSLNLANPAIVQPIFSAPTYGYLYLTLTQSGSVIDLTGAPLSAPQLVQVQANNESLTVDSITSGGGINITSGGVLSAAANAAINLVGDYTVTTQTVDSTNHPVVVQPTFAPGSTGSLNLTFTQSGATTDLSSTPLSAPGSVSVSLASSDSNQNLTVGSVTAGSDVSLYTGSYETTGGALTIGSINAGGDVNLTTSYYYYSGGGPITSGAIVAGGSVTASGGYYASSTYSFDDITAGGDVNISTGYYYGGALTAGAISAGGQVSLSTGIYDNGALTVGPITAGSDVNLSAGAASSGVMTVDSIASGGNVTLDAGGALMTAGEGVSVQTGGSYSATGSTIDPLLFQPTFTGAFGDLSLTFNGPDGADLTSHPLSAPGGSVSVSANDGDLTVDSITALNDITLFASGDLIGAEVSPLAMTLGGDYSATGTTIDSRLYQPIFTSGSTGSLSLTFNEDSDGGFIDLTGHPLTAPGSISISAANEDLTVDSLTAGGDITLFAAGQLFQADVSPFAITLGGNYSATASFIDPGLTQPIFTTNDPFGSLSLHYTGSEEGVDLTGVPLAAPGSVSVTTDFASLTVDSITAGGDVSLTANNGSVILAPTAAIILGGSYNLSELTIDPSALHPIYVDGSTGDFNLTVLGSGGADLTGSPLSAPGSVSVSAPNEDLTVDSITAGADVTLNSGGDLANASGAVISLGGDYSATGVTISTGLLQPAFTSDSTGSLSLTFNQSESSIDLTGSPLTAPGSITINVNGSDENLTVDTLTAGQDVNISTNYYYNTGALTAGVINAGGSVSLSTGGYYPGALTVGSIDAGGSVNLSTSGYYAGAPLTVGPITAGSDVTMSTGGYAAGVMTVSTISAGGDVSLSAGGPLSAASTISTTGGGIDFSANNGDVTVGVLTAADSVTLYANSGDIVGASATGVTLGGDYSATGATIDTRLYQPTFTEGSSGSLSLTFRQTGGVIDLTGFALTAPGSISLNSSEDLTIDSLTAGPDSQVQLNASGALNEVGSAVITAQGLYASAYNGITLNGANAVQVVYNLNNNDTGGISFTNQGDIHLDGAVSASGQTVNLVSNTGEIVEDDCGYYCSAIIYAGTLTASAVTGINLTQTYYFYYTNEINNIGPVSNSTSGGINILNQSDLTLVGDVSAPGQTVNIVSENGALNQTGGVITAALFTASAANGITLNDANAVAALGALSNSDSGGISFTNAGDLSIAGDLTADFQTVNLVSNTGALTEGAGTIVTAETLTGSAATGFHFDQTNEVARLGDVANTGSGGVSFTNDGDVVLTGDVSAAGQTVSFVSQTGAILQGTGAVTAGALDLAAVTGVDLSGPNEAAQLGAITTTSGNVNFVNAGSFALTDDFNLIGQSLSLASNGGSISQSGGAINADSLTASAATGLSLTGSNVVANLGVLQNGATGGIAYTTVGDLTLTHDIDGFAQTVSLISQTGALTQAAPEVVTAGVLTASAANGVSLGSANAVTDLGLVSNSGSGGVTINNASSLTILGAVQAAGQAVNLSGASSINQLGGAITADTLSVSAVDGIVLTNVAGSIGPLVNTTAGGIVLDSAGDLQLGSNITAPGQGVALNAQGAIVQNAGAITAGILFLSANTGIDLGGANQVAALGDSFNTASGFTLNNIGDLALTGNVSAPGQTLSLATTGALDQASGQIEASTLVVSAENGISLTGDNLVVNLGGFSNPTTGGVTYVSAGDPNLTGDIFAPGQTVTLVAETGGFNQTAGVITAGTLNVLAAYGIALTDANVVGALGQLVNSTSGGIAFTNVGDIDLSVDLAAAGQVVSLASTSGAITQSGGETITAQTLNASGASGVTLDNTNTVVNLGVLSAGSGGISFTDAVAPVLTGDITAPGQLVSLVSDAGALVQTAGIITAGALNASATTGIALNDANAVSALGTLSNSGSGGISFTNAGGFALTSDLIASGQDVNLTSTAGAISQTGGAVAAQTVELNAGAGLSLSSVTADDQVTIIANGVLSLVPAGDSTVALQAPSVVIEGRAGLIDLGDGLTTPGFGGLTVTNAGFNAIRADAISFYAGYFAGPTSRLDDLGPQNAGAIKVGTLSWNTAGLDEPEGGSSLSLFAGPGSTIAVTGSITPTTVGTGNLLIGDSVADAWTPKAILVSGGIGATGSTLQEVNAVELNAVSSVVFGSTNFISQVESAIADGRTSSINITLGLPGGVFSTGTNAIFLGANSVTLRAQGAIVSQNTGSDTTEGGIVLPNDNRAAAVLTLGTTSASTTTPTPVVVDLFGGVTDATGLALTGKDVAPSSEVVLETPLLISDSYRFNSCTIGKSNVCVVKSLPVKLIEGVILTTEAPAPLPSYAITPLITFKPLEPIGDPTITGVGNEEIWRGPSCDPKGETPCP
jgi:filamentous hemagglutinin family protein